MIDSEAFFVYTILKVYYAPNIEKSQTKMKKDQIIKALLWCAVALWMAVIFSFSAQNAEASSERSDSVVETVIKYFDRNFDSLTAAEQAARCERLSFAVRKAAHFSAFAVLGVLTASAVSRHTVSLKLTAVLSEAVCVLYAVSDEIHQYFVPGRACRLFDIGVDSAGCTPFILITLAVIHRYRRRSAARQGAAV